MDSARSISERFGRLWEAAQAVPIIVSALSCARGHERTYTCPQIHARTHALSPTHTHTHTHTRTHTNTLVHMQHTNAQATHTHTHTHTLTAPSELIVWHSGSAWSWPWPWSGATHLLVVRAWAERPGRHTNVPTVPTVGKASPPETGTYPRGSASRDLMAFHGMNDSERQQYTVRKPKCHQIS